MKSIGLRLPEKLRKKSGWSAGRLQISRAERLAEVSRRVREESMRVNAEFAAVERDPNALRAS
jgi:hypothetical protein